MSVIEDPMALECRSIKSRQGDSPDVPRERTLMDIWKEFGADTSLHGIGRAINSKAVWKKLVWSVLVIGSACVSAVNFYQTVVSFLTYPVTTNIELQSHRHMVFPAVTICNLNPARFSALEGRIQNALIDTLERGEGEDKLEKMYKLFVSRVYGDREKNGEDRFYGMYHMLVGCYFDMEECRANEFETFYSFKYGKCFSFNTDQESPKTIEKAGNSNGLILELDIQQDEYLPFVSTSGIKVLVHPQTDMAFPEDSGIIVGPGRATSIGIRKVEIKRQPPPWGKCIDAKESNNERINMFRDEYKYTQTVCEKTCYQMSVVSECQCCDGSYPCNETTLVKITEVDVENDTLSECDESGRKVLNCLKQVRAKYFSGYLPCMQTCQPACKEVIYRTNYATGSWPGENFERTLINKANRTMARRRTVAYPDPMTSSYVSKNFLRVEIYFENFVEEQVTAKPAYDWNKLLSDIGGTMGLWLGFSIMTAVEILEFIYEGVRHLVRKFRSFRNQRTNPESLF